MARTDTTNANINKPLRQQISTHADRMNATKYDCERPNTRRAAWAACRYRRRPDAEETWLNMRRQPGQKHHVKAIGFGTTDQIVCFNDWTRNVCAFEGEYLLYVFASSNAQWCEQHWWLSPWPKFDADAEFSPDKEWWMAATTLAVELSGCLLHCRYNQMGAACGFVVNDADVL